MGDKLMESAVRAYHRWGGKEQPSNNDSGRFKYEEKDYLVLTNVNGVLAIFEVSPAGLRRLSGYLEQEIQAAWERPGARGYRSPISEADSCCQAFKEWLSCPLAREHWKRP